MKILIAGCGYLGSRLAARLLEEKHTVWGLRRDVSSLEKLKAFGFTPVAIDLNDTAALSSLPQATHAVLCQAPSRPSDNYRKTYVEATRRFFDAVAPFSLHRALFISSTSVYAQENGGWVDELTKPDSGSYASVDAEQKASLLLEAERVAKERGAIVLRLSGIYGPGRNRLEALKSGRWVPPMTDAFTNRIHVEDAVSAIAFLLEKGKGGEIYLASDEMPTPQKEFASWLCAEVGITVPVPSSETGQKGKRCSNRKLKAAGFKFVYPTFREGYAPLLAQSAAV